MPSHTFIWSIECTEASPEKVTAKSTSNRGEWFQKEVRLYVSLWKNGNISLCNSFSSEFMVSVSSFKSSSMQHDVHLVNYGPT